MHADALITAARDATGLDDLGPASYREGLEVLVASLTAEAALNEIGVAALEAQVTSALSHRLKVVDWVARHPEVLEAAIEAPLFVLGMPRTGTTHVSYLLDQDPARRSLLRWESSDGVPPPTPDELRSGPRVDAARASQTMLDTLNPGFHAIHHEDADGPTECVVLLAQDFKSLLWETLANVPSYSEWLLATDQRSAYAYHRLALQVLQSRAPGRWTLKSPHHSIALDVLVETYPDAKLLMTHRDPVAVIGSVCSLVASLSGTFSDRDHRAYIASHWPDVMEETLRRAADFRRANPGVGFVDLPYRELLTDGVAAMRRVCDELGQPLTEAAESAMRAYESANRQGTRGTHSYDLADFGLDARELADRFAWYPDAFGLDPADLRPPTREPR